MAVSEWRKPVGGADRGVGPWSKWNRQHAEFDNARRRSLTPKPPCTNAQQQRDLAFGILTRIELGHKEGVRSSFELNTAQNQLLEAEGNLIGAQLAWLNAQQRLIASNPRP